MIVVESLWDIFSVENKTFAWNGSENKTEYEMRLKMINLSVLENKMC